MKVLCFDDCIIATGSVTSNPPLPNMDLPQVMDSTAALNCTEPPQSVTVIHEASLDLSLGAFHE